MKALLFISFLFSLIINSNAQVPRQQNRERVTIDEYSIKGKPALGTANNRDEENASAGFYQKNGKYGFAYPHDSLQNAIYDNIAYAENGFVVKKDGFYGIANKKGILISKLEYDSISYINHVYLIKKNGKYGTLANDGKTTLLSLKYHKIIFSTATNAISIIANANNEMQILINENQKIIVQKIDYAEVYANLTIAKSNGKFGVIKKETVIPFEYDSIFIPQSKDYSTYYNNTSQNNRKPTNFNYTQSYKFINTLGVSKNGKLGLQDSDGNIIYATDNDAIDNVEIKSYYTIQKGKLFGIYFTNSKKKTEVEFDYVYSDGVGYVMALKNKKAGVFTITGEQITPFEYDNEFIAQYSGIGLRVTKNKKRGIIDTKGVVIIEPIYDDISTFYDFELENLFYVTLNKKRGIINRKGEPIIPIKYEWIGSENGRIKVITPEPENMVGLYNKKGEVIVADEYKWITRSSTEFSKLPILIKNDSSINFLSTKNKIILPENICEYGYVADENKLLNPFSSSNIFLLYLKNKNGKYGMLNEKTETLVIPFAYDEIMQRFESDKHTYYSIRKGKKYGLINEQNMEIIPAIYDSISIDLLRTNFNDKTDETYQVVVKKGNKFGSVNFKNQVKIPFVYNYLQRISENGFYKAKKENKYQIINLKGELINPNQFDEVANFEEVNDSNTPVYEALTFFNGKMKVINEKGKFTTSEVAMQAHSGYTSFNELKFALVKALNSNDNILLKEFVEKIAPSEHILFYLKQNLFDKSTLYPNITLVKEKYFSDLQNFKRNEWNADKSRGYSGYNHSHLTNITDFTFYTNGVVTNRRDDDPAFGDTRFMEKLLRNAIKVNGYWISTYFMKKNFERYYH